MASSLLSLQAKPHLAFSEASLSFRPWAAVSQFQNLIDFQTGGAAQGCAPLPALSWLHALPDWPAANPHPWVAIIISRPPPQAIPEAPTTLLLCTSQSLRAVERCQWVLAPADAARSCSVVVLHPHFETSFPGLHRPRGKANLILTPSKGPEKSCIEITHHPLAQLEEPFGHSPGLCKSPHRRKGSAWKPTCQEAPWPGPVRAF